jgi:hypothetical protein
MIFIINFLMFFIMNSLIIKHLQKEIKTLDILNTNCLCYRVCVRTLQ